MEEVLLTWGGALRIYNPPTYKYTNTRTHTHCFLYVDENVTKEVATPMAMLLLTAAMPS